MGQVLKKILDLFTHPFNRDLLSIFLQAIVKSRKEVGVLVQSWLET